MSEKAKLLLQAPKVDIKNHQQRKLLEAELFSLDAQIRNFGRIRDRLSAAGKDGTSFYRDMGARRDQIVAALKQVGSGIFAPKLSEPRTPFPRLDRPLLALPIAPAKFVPKTGIFGFGTSGFVQMAPASEGANDVPPGPATGQIVTIDGAPPGAVFFSGDLNFSPQEVSPAQLDPTINYFWIHNWTYLIPFPPPTVTSLFTYRFDVYALASVYCQGGPAQAMSFVSLGETANLTTGSDIVTNIDGGWPLNADLTQPAPEYNGFYGNIFGHVTVQRSFMVPGGHVPGVAVVVGAIGALALGTEVRFTFTGDSQISIGADGMDGRVAYSYEPRWVVDPSE
jgi:hypothetical protein